MLTQLKNLKKHLHKEQIQVENQLNNAVITTKINYFTIYSNKFLINRTIEQQLVK